MNIATSLAELQTYFQRLGDVHPLLKKVIIGDSEMILSYDRSKLDYPILWVETPSVSWSFADLPERYYDLNFVVLYNSPTDTWQHQQYILHQSLKITEDLLAKMRSDTQLGVIDIKDRSANSRPVLGYGHDHDYGWRTSLRIRAYMDSCASDCTWSDACPVGSLARFTFHNDTPEDLTTLVFEDASLPADEAWVTNWTWCGVDGVLHEDKLPPANIAPGNWLFVTLTITLGDCELTASRLVRVGENCGESVPYLLDKKYC